MSVEKCLLCLRVPLETLLGHSRKLYDNEEMAKKVANKAAKLLRSAYLKSPADMCGKSPTGLMAGALYLAGIIEGEWKTQDNISQVVGVTLTTIRNRYTHLIDLLDLEMESFPTYGTKHVKTRTKQAKSLIETRRQNREAAKNVVTWADEVLEPGKVYRFYDMLKILENKARSEGFPRVTSLPWFTVAETLMKGGIIEIPGYPRSLSSEKIVYILAHARAPPLASHRNPIISL